MVQTRAQRKRAEAQAKIIRLARDIDDDGNEVEPFNYWARETPLKEAAPSVMEVKEERPSKVSSAFKTRADFSTPMKYTAYLKGGVLQYGMKVKATMECWPINAGEIGTFVWFDSGDPWLCWCDWPEKGRRWIFVDRLEVVPP